ncbi:MAG: fructosamine kinase family protein [Cyanobium sp.]
MPRLVRGRHAGSAMHPDEATAMRDDPLASWLKQQLGVELQRRTALSGGSIHHAWRLELAGGELLFAKGGERQSLPLLEAEADGLAALAAAAEGSGLHVPAPLALGGHDTLALLVLPWLPLRSGGAAGDWQALGRSLARLHRGSLKRACAAGDRGGSHHGWIRDNVIGATPQANGWLEDWGRFFTERRLAPQLERLARRGIQLQGAEALLEQVPAWLACHRPAAVLVHGDLWCGNASLLAGGGGALFDPAVHRGDREVDLAMAHLFGGFPPEFFRGYEQDWPLPEGHHQRQSLYNLYHLLNHANLFGGGYRSQAQACLTSLLATPPVA